MSPLKDTQALAVPEVQTEQEDLLSRLLDEVFSLSGGEDGPRSGAAVEFIAKHKNDHPEFEELAAIILYARERELEAEQAA